MWAFDAPAGKEEILNRRVGENELAVAVAESFGGWGLVARFEDLEGIEVDPALP